MKINQAKLVFSSLEEPVAMCLFFQNLHDKMLGAECKLDECSFDRSKQVVSCQHSDNGYGILIVFENMKYIDKWGVKGVFRMIPMLKVLWKGRLGEKKEACH